MDKVVHHSIPLTIKSGISPRVPPILHINRYKSMEDTTKINWLNLLTQTSNLIEPSIREPREFSSYVLNGVQDKIVRNKHTCHTRTPIVKLSKK